MADQDSNHSDDDAAWRDLVARYDAPLTAEEPVPWPDREGDGATGVAVVPVPRVVRGARDATGPGLAAGADQDDEHFIPPPPPPLPRLDPLAKGAWLALFGGPGYLVVATAAGWTVPGFAAFCAVAAFVAGFAILVLRMHEPGPGGPNDGDDGAVV